MNLKIRISCIFAIAVLLPVFVAAQELSEKIRGYKVHPTVVHIVGQEGSQSKNIDAAAEVSIGQVKVADLGLAGVTIDAEMSFTPSDQNGRVDFLTFRDFRVNGIAFEIEEFKHTFTFKRGKQTALPVPARVLIRVTGIANAAFRELIKPKSEWTITGRIFVFGKFKKFGIGFKRVILGQIDLKIPNPIKSLARNEN